MHIYLIAEFAEKLPNDSSISKASSLNKNIWTVLFKQWANFCLKCAIIPLKPNTWSKLLNISKICENWHNCWVACIYVPGFKDTVLSLVSMRQCGFNIKSVSLPSNLTATSPRSVSLTKNISSFAENLKKIIWCLAAIYFLAVIRYL